MKFVKSLFTKKNLHKSAIWRDKALFVTTFFEKNFEWSGSTQKGPLHWPLIRGQWSDEKNSKKHWLQPLRLLCNHPNTKISDCTYFFNFRALCESLRIVNARTIRCGIEFTISIKYYWHFFLEELNYFLCLKLKIQNTNLLFIIHICSTIWNYLMGWVFC